VLCTCTLSALSIFYAFHRVLPPHALEVERQRVSLMVMSRPRDWGISNEGFSSKRPVCTYLHALFLGHAASITS
jgi:hypothetical protein